MQDAFKAQMDSTKKYSEFASSQFKALSEVRDTDSLQHFFKGQMEGFSELNEQLIEDLKSLVEREKSSNMALAQFWLILNLNKQMKNRVKQPKVHLKKKWLNNLNSEYISMHVVASDAAESYIQYVQEFIKHSWLTTQHSAAFGKNYFNMI